VPFPDVSTTMAPFEVAVCMAAKFAGKNSKGTESQSGMLNVSPAYLIATLFL
jgi:hypothetical protein